MNPKIVFEIILGIWKRFSIFAATTAAAAWEWRPSQDLRWKQPPPKVKNKGEVGRPVVRTSGHLDIWTSRHLDVYGSGHLETQGSGYPMRRQLEI